MASSWSYNTHPGARLEGSTILRKAGGALLLALSLALFALSGNYLVKDLSLWAFGRPVQATVVDLWVERSDSGETQEITFNYYLRYQFATPDGRIFERVSPASAMEWSMLSPGEPLQPGQVSPERSGYSSSGEGGNTQVKVLYFPLFPQLNRLDDRQYIPILACLYVPILGLALIIAWFGFYLLGRY